jgi:hypothetical protein
LLPTPYNAVLKDPLEGAAVAQPGQDLLLPGLSVNTGPTDYRVVKEFRMMRVSQATDGRRSGRLSPIDLVRLLAAAVRATQPCRLDEGGLHGQPDRVPCQGNARHHQTVIALSLAFH